MALRVRHLELFVSDMERSRDFYVNKLGFEEVAVHGQFLWLKNSDFELLLRAGDVRSSGDVYGTFGPALVLYTDDSRGIVKKLTQSGVAQVGCDGDFCCPLFRDPDGYWIQIVDPGDQI